MCSGSRIVPALVVELLDRAHQPQVALLDQVQQRHSRRRVGPGHADHEPQVALDQARLRGLVAHVLAAGQIQLLLVRE
jgi:hypothetical protein